MVSWVGVGGFATNILEPVIKVLGSTGTNGFPNSSTITSYGASSEISPSTTGGVVGVGGAGVVPPNSADNPLGT